MRQPRQDCSISNSAISDYADAGDARCFVIGNADETVCSLSRNHVISGAAEAAAGTLGLRFLVKD
jgi:hypothetical protein